MSRWSRLRDVPDSLWTPSGIPGIPNPLLALYRAYHKSHRATILVFRRWVPTRERVYTCRLQWRLQNSLDTTIKWAKPMGS